MDSQVKFASRGSGYKFYLTPAGAVMVLSKHVADEKADVPRGAAPRRSRTAAGGVLGIKFEGADPQSEVAGLDELPGKSNYFLGSDTRKWRTGVPNYAKVKYHELYPGIDVIYYGNQRQLEYDFIVAPGADPRAIKISFEGARKLRVDGGGNLVVAMAGGAVKQQKPAAYQELNGQRREVASRYVITGRRRVAIEVGAYDADKPLIIDPVISYSTFLGGTDYDDGMGIAVDGSGNAYVVGRTYSTDLPTVNPFQPVHRGGVTQYFTDAFVAKFNPAGSALVYSTYLGGGDSDEPSDLATDQSGNVYVTGKTLSSDFPLSNPYQGTRRGETDAFVTKLNATGDGLVYSTYLGGDGFNNEDVGNDVAVDSNGSAYVIGSTHSTNFPTTPGCFQPAIRRTGWPDSFVTKFNPTGTALEYSTYLGGRDTDHPFGIAVDPAGNAYVTGYTGSIDFPTLNAVQPTKAGADWLDGFVTKLNASGTGLEYSTYLGGTYNDSGSAIAVDSSGNAYVAGSTNSINFPTANAFQPTFSGGTDPWNGETYSDAFVTKLSATGAGLIYSTYLGGNNYDGGGDIAVDPAGNAYVVGETESTNFPRVSALQSAHGGDRDAFITKFGPTGLTVTFSTYLGGADSDGATGIAVDSAGSAYVTGATCSTTFPTVNPARPYNGVCDAFVSKISGLNTYSLRGKVSDANGNGIGLVTVTLSGSRSATTQTDAGGNYSFQSLDAGGNYTVTPSKAPYTFVPPSQTFNNLNNHQTADFGVLTYSLGGRVVDASGQGLPEVALALSGTQPGTTRTDAGGDYSFPAVAAGGSYVITPSKSDPILTYSFAPASQPVSSLNGNRTGVDFSSTATIVSTLNPLADAYVQDGTSASTNFGAATTLRLQTDNRSGTGKNADVYFKFDVSGVSGYVSSAKLRAYAALSAGGTVSTSAYPVSDTSWVERGMGSITWNNKPARSSTAITGATAAVASTTFATFDIDVTSYIRSEKSAGRDAVSLALHNPSTSNPYITLNSREAAANKPQLIVTTSPGNAPPTVSLTSPANGAAFTAPATVTLTAGAGDWDGSISKVEFYAGTSLIGTATASPYSTTWGNVTAGTYALTAVATDNSGLATTSATAVVTVNAPNVPPAVSLNAPAANTTFPAGANIALAATAGDPDGGITKVEFFAGATLVGTATTSPYGITWSSAPAGAHTLTAKATDNAGGVTTSAPVTVNVVWQTGLSPAADAYVRDGTSAGTNFGTAAELQTRASATAGDNRESYLRFDLTSVSGGDQITNVKLRLYGRLSDAGSSNVPVAAYSVSNTTWVESGSGSITWNNSRTWTLAAQATTTVTDDTARWYEWDVTAYAKGEKLAGRNVVSLALKDTAPSTSYATFNSKEAPVHRPQLVITTTAARAALLVTGSATLNNAENQIKTRLQNLGFAVTVKAAGSTNNTAVKASDADGKALVVISSTVTPTNVTNKFRDVAVPVVNWEAAVMGDMALTGAASGASFGTLASQRQLAIADPAHPLAAGLSGTVEVLAPAAPNDTFTWGVPGPGGVKVAALAGNADKAAVFCYDTGAALFTTGLYAPARRVGLFLTDATAANLGSNGWALFEGAVKWAAAPRVAPTVTGLTPTTGVVGTTVTLAGYNFGDAQGDSTLTFNGVAAGPTGWGGTTIVAPVPAGASTGPVVVTVGGLASNGVTFTVNVQPADTDGDGLPDGWEMQHFGNLSQGANGDPDGDGLTNLQEHLQGRNPTKSALADSGDFVNLKVYTPLVPPIN